jgi:glutamate dehydrogenase/leucine dehydrogenase
MSGPSASTDLEAEVFGLLGDEYEQVVWCHDAEVGLRAIVAVHSTVLGPALGGTRFKAYASETDALVDVLRLARGMTYKQAVAGLDYGGGKAVIIGDPGEVRTDALVRRYGQMVDRMAGTYLTAEDVGTTQADMDLIAEETRYVTGTSKGSGDPSPATAWGLMHAILAVATRLWGERSVADRHVVVSGVGKVGSALVHHLRDAGARVSVADVNGDAVRSIVAATGATAIHAADAHRTPCDIWAPCALGAVLNARSIPELACSAVCGAANNQLAAPGDDERVAARGILYVPDFVANAGGVINICEEPGGYDRERAMRHVAEIEGNVHRVLDRAEADGLTTAVAADLIAEDRLAAARAGGRHEGTARAVAPAEAPEIATSLSA